MAETFCPGCGEPLEVHARSALSAVTAAGCLPELDPPRYCAGCGGWLAVRVSTGGWAARCRRCDTATRSA